MTDISSIGWETIVAENKGVAGRVARLWGTAAELPPAQARRLRRLRRRCAMGVALALVVLIDSYLPGADAWMWIDWTEPSIAAALVFDVIVRPLLPTEVVLRFGPRDE